MFLGMLNLNRNSLVDSQKSLGNNDHSPRTDKTQIDNHKNQEERLSKKDIF